MTDLDIAKSVEPTHIKNIAIKANISEDNLEYYGKYKAKLPHSIIDKDMAQQRPDSSPSIHSGCPICQQ